MNKYVIYLIEDRKENADKTLEKLNDIAPKYKTEVCDFEFKLLEGTNAQEFRGEQYVFYDQSILEKIRVCKANETKQGNRMGLLLDTLLTKEDIVESGKSYYSHVSISRDIYFRFKDELPIYIVTATATFASYSDIIMGENLSKQFINQVRLKNESFDTLKEDIDRLFKFYREFKQEIIDEGIGKNEQQMGLVGA